MKKIMLTIYCAFICFFNMAFCIQASEVNKALPIVPLTPQIQNQPQLVSEKKAPENSYNYNPLAKPDPFRPFVEQEVAAKKKEEKKDVTSIFPLQRVEIDKFRVVGIAGTQERRVAIVEDATKKFFPLFTGTHIGVHNGKVAAILSDRIIVEEYETKKAKRIILKLHKN
jgi:type IV pilus assembly protein PilP